VVSISGNLEIRDNQVFPYNAANTINPQWKAYLSSTVDGITGIKISNKWAYDQKKQEYSASKLLLEKNQTLSINDSAYSVNYGGNDSTEYKTNIGGDTFTLTDKKGVQRDIPLVIALGSGTNTFKIAGNTYSADIDTTKNRLRYWKKPITIIDPLNPVGTQNVDWFDMNYFDNKVTSGDDLVSLEIDPDWSKDVEYYFAADEATSQFWLLLGGKQIFETKGAEIAFTATTMDNNGSQNYNYLPYYWPDQSTYNVLEDAGFAIAPAEGDKYEFVALWDVIDKLGVEATIYQSTANGLLVNSTNGKIRIPQADAEVKSEQWTINLNEYATSNASRLKQAYTGYGTRITVENGVASIYTIDSQRLVFITHKADYISELWQQDIALNGDRTQHTTDVTDIDEFSYQEFLHLDSAVVLQDIADGVNPGEILLEIPSGGLVYEIKFLEPIPFGEERTISFMGKKYKVVESSPTKIVLIEIPTTSLALNGTGVGTGQIVRPPVPTRDGNVCDPPFVGPCPAGTTQTSCGCE